MLRFTVVLCFCVLSSVYAALSDDEKEGFHKMVEPAVKACMEKHGLEAEDLKEMKKKKEMDPCFVACIFKSSGTIDSNGKFDYEASLNLAKEVVKDEKFLDEMRKMGEICMKVNDEEVADDCGRANLMMKCFHDNKGDWMLLIGRQRRRFRGGRGIRRREELDASRERSIGDETQLRNKRGPSSNT